MRLIYVCICVIATSCSVNRNLSFNYWNIATGLTNYYVGDNYDISSVSNQAFYNSKFEWREKYDSIEVRNAHVFSAMNNHVIQADHYLNFHLKENAYLPHLAYSLNVELKKEKVKKDVYFRDWFSGFSECLKCDYYPYFQVVKFRDAFSSLENQELKKVLSENDVYLYEFKEYGHKITRNQVAYSYLDIIDSEINDVRDKKLFSLIINHRQYFLTSWFYAYRNSCRQLWDGVFKAIIDTSEFWQDKFKGYSTNSLTSFVVKNIPKKDFRNNALKGVNNNLKYRKQILFGINEMLNRRNIFIEYGTHEKGLLTAYFYLILKNDFAPENIMLQKIIKRPSLFRDNINYYKKRSLRSGWLVEMKFYSKRQKRWYSLKFDLNVPYEYEVKEL